MKIKTMHRVLPCLMLLVNLASAQTRPSLIPSEEFVVPSEWRQPLILPARCDDAGRIFLRKYESAGRSPITRLSEKGDKSTVLSIEAEPKLKDGKVQDFAIGSDGTLYQLVQVGSNPYVATFSDEGKCTSATKLERGFWGSKLAVIGDLLLVSGTEMPEEGSAAPRIVNALFQSTGSLIREISWSGDPSAVETNQSQNVSPSKYYSGKTSLPLLLGNLEGDKAGNMYVVRSSVPPMVFILNSSGEFVRSVSIPVPERDMQPGTIHIRSGRIAALFQSLDQDGNILKRVLTITDAVTGERVNEFLVPQNIGAAFACYTGSEFTFITTRAGKLVIQHTRPN